MPSGPKKRKIAKKRKQLEIQPLSPTHSQEGSSDDPTVISPNGTEKQDIEEDKRDFSRSSIDDEVIKGSDNGNDGESEQKTEKEGVVVVVSEELIPSISIASNSVNRSNGYSSGGCASSRSSSDEEFQSERELGKLVDSDLMTVPAIDPIGQVVSPLEEVSPAVESSPVKDLGVSNVIDFRSDGNEEKALQLQGVNPRDEGELHKEAGNSTSSENKMTLALPPARPSSWRSCCGLFEVLTRTEHT